MRRSERYRRMDALAEYFAAKHEALEGVFKDNCLTIARDIARLLLDQGEEPYIMKLERFEQRGENRYYGPIMPLRYRGASTFTQHYVCCCDDRAFDPIHPEPLKINEYSNALFGVEIPMQMFVPAFRITDYLAAIENRKPRLPVF